HRPRGPPPSAPERPPRTRARRDRHPRPGRPARARGRAASLKRETPGYDSGMTDPSLAAVRALLERERPRREVALARARPIAADDPDVLATLEDLASEETAASLARDPYWPKWASPWWKLLLLRELGLLHLAPPAALEALARAV